MTVYLVGAGPGDPGLLTVAGARLLARADVVVHDRLVDERTLALARSDARIIDVGKAPNSSGVSQASINELLVDLGREHTVVRLKGGDSFVFARGGEEAAALEAAGVAYEVVPGVPSFAAVPEAAGVPLTMRGAVSSFTVVSGHDPEGSQSPPVDWAGLAASNATLVVLMGVARRGEIAKLLIAGGRAPTTPVIVVERGTLPEQRSIRTTLARLGAVGVENPATIVVGELASLELFSYEHRPLASWRIVLTRPLEQVRELAEGIELLGGRPVIVPMIEVTEPSDGGAALARSLEQLGAYSWAVFTSTNAVAAVRERVRDARALAGVKVAAIGVATAAALRSFGVVADLVARSATAAGLVADFPTPDGVERAVLVPQSRRARSVLTDGLRELGYLVEVVEAYDVAHRVVAAGQLEAITGAHAVVFTSSSTVSAFVSSVPASALVNLVVTIGPATSATARDAGLRVDREASDHSTAGILDALVALASPASLERGGARG